MIYFHQLSSTMVLLFVSLFLPLAFAQNSAIGNKEAENFHVSRATLIVRQDFSVAFHTGGNRIEMAINESPGSRLQASGGTAPYRYRILAGRLPSGISLGNDGVFMGRSSTSGNYRFRVRAEDANGQVSVTEFSIAVHAAQLSGRVSSFNITSSTTGRALPFSIYLPPGYGASNRRYPVIYHLHGIGGFHDGNHLQSVPRSLESAVRNGLIGHAILVFPDGFRDSFWADAITGAQPAETHLVEDLINHIDTHYRTLSRREARIIQGYSMGGFGAAKFATKYPELFSVCVIYDGAMLSWADLLRNPNHVRQVAEVFGSSEVYFNQYSPWYWLTRNADTLAISMKFRSSAGALQVYNRNWYRALTSTNQNVEYVETGLSHNLGSLLNAQGANSWDYIGQHLELTR